MECTVRLSAYLTRQTTVTEFPVFRQSILRYLKLVGMGTGLIRRILTAVIVSSERVDQILVNLPCGATQSKLNSSARPLENMSTTPETPDGTQSEPTSGAGMAPRETEEILNHHAPQHELATPYNPQQQVSTQWRNPLSALEVREDTRALGEAIVAALASGQVESRIVMTGMANLARSGDLQETLAPSAETPEKQVVLLKLFNRTYEPEPVLAITSQKSGHEVLCGTTIMSSGHDASGATWARVGMIDPTRVDYPDSTRAV